MMRNNFHRICGVMDPKQVLSIQYHHLRMWMYYLTN